MSLNERNQMFKSLAWKFVYGAVVTILAVASGYVQVNTDPAAWTIAGFAGGLAVAFVSFVKKFALNALLGDQ